MVKSLGKFLLGRRVRRNRGAPPAPVVEYIAPAPVVSPEGIFSAPAPVDEYIAPAPAVYVAPAPVVEYIAPFSAVYAAPALVEEYIAPAPAVYAAPAPVEEYIAPAPAVYAAPARVEEYIAPAPAVYAASAPVDKYITLAPAVFAAPAPSLEYIAPAPAVYAAPAPVVELSPAPAAIQAPIPAVEFITPVPSVFHAPTPVVESVAQCHAPVFPLSPDASDMSSPEDVYTRSWESLPVPIKSFTQVESAEPLNLASETPTVFHGRDLPAGRRDGLVGHALWLRKEAARRGYAWRQQQRARQLSSLRAACVPPSGNVGEALRYAPSGAGVLVEALRELATRGTSPSGTGSGKGAGARVAVRSVLEDHETAILELEQVELLEKRVRDVETFASVVDAMRPGCRTRRRGACGKSCRWPNSTMI